MTQEVSGQSPLGALGMLDGHDIEEFEFCQGTLWRNTRHRDGRVSQSTVPAQGAWLQPETDLRSAYDMFWLRAKNLPRPEGPPETVRVVDLFAGCGGMTLGLAEAARALGMGCETRLAMDTHAGALRVFQSNFPCKRVSQKPVESVFGDDPRHATIRRDVLQDLGRIDVLLGGPPCQGHSNLNNHSRRDDTRNALFFLMAKAAELLNPEHVIIENVRDIVHDRNGVFETTRDYLRSVLGYRVKTVVLKAEYLGVPQRRHRIFLVATRRANVRLDDIVAPFVISTPRSFAWACADLYDCAANGVYNSASVGQEVTAKRIAWLFDHDEYDLPDRLRPPCHRDGKHSYPSVYGRLREDLPSQTITTGFSYMGQGRYVHPRLPRTLTPHEAARLQFFPDSFAFGRLKRSEYGYLIGNAVPPKLTYILGLQLLR